jgi:hypothetical protein
VDDRVGRLENAQAVDGQRSRAAREMRVSEKRDQKRPGRKAPSR